MSYYARGFGAISVSGEVDIDRQAELSDEYGDAIIFTNFIYDEVTDETKIHLCYDGNYFEEEFNNLFDFLLENYNVLDGEIELTGEENDVWRFKYYKSRNEFVEESGKVSYKDITVDRLLEILRDYVDNDLNNADTDYVREVLRDVCGMTKDELKATGFDYLFDKEEEE